MAARSGARTIGFALVVIRQRSTGRWLAVNESRNRGWWLPAGGVELAESFEEAAHREVGEEAGAKIELKGVLRVEHDVYGASHTRMRVVYYAEPVDEAAPVKSEPDDHSNGAAWLSVADLRKLESEGALRGEELLRWSEYLEAGGPIYPMSVLASEDQGPLLLPPVPGGGPPDMSCFLPFTIRERDADWHAASAGEAAAAAGGAAAVAPPS